MSSGAQHRISVIIPTYNRAHELRPAVESALSQSLSVSEVIVVDDGSTDHTPDVVASLPQGVRSLRQPNQGPAAARNAGLELATGDLIAFLDVDDRWEPVKIEVQAALLDARPDVGWCTANMRGVDRAGTPRVDRGDLSRLVPVFSDLGVSMTDWFATHLERDVLSHGDRTFEYFHGDAFALLLHGNFVFPSATMIRRTVAEQVGPFNPHFNRTEDNDYFLRMSRAARMAVLTEPLVDYRVGEPDAMTASRHAGELIDQAMECLRQAVDREPEPADSEVSAYRTGRELLHRRKIYTKLSNLDRTGARAAIGEFWREREGVDLETLPHFLATFLPTSVMRALRVAKRILTSRKGRFAPNSSRRGATAQPPKMEGEPT